MRWLVRIAVALSVLAITLLAAYQISPWPGAIVIRTMMDRGGVAMNDALRKHVPASLTTIAGEQYDPADPDAFLDVHLPGSSKAGDRLPVIVWIHGGAFISGDKSQIANYASIVADQGYAVVALNYSLGPGANYPKPVRQVQAALKFIVENAQRLRLDMTHVVLAGDSAGAQLAAQTVAIVSSPDYAALTGIIPAITRQQLRGAILHCGIYDAKLIRTDGPFGFFMRAVGWSYFGKKDFLSSPAIPQFSVIEHVTRDFPPVFISGGNADPLLPHSLAMADALAAKGVKVERLFFPKDYTPQLQHEYQFDLESEAGRLALKQSLDFLRAISLPAGTR